MLSVAIKSQSGGVGSLLMRAAFDASASTYRATRAVVIALSVRDDVIAWYKRYTVPSFNLPPTLPSFLLFYPT
jgi:hypothetical protein